MINEKWQRLKKTFGLSILFLYITGSAWGQSIRGNIKLENDSPAVAAIITVTDSSQKIITFTKSDRNGNYEISIPLSTHTQWLEVNLYGYKKARKEISGNMQVCNFVLEANAITLQEVKVKPHPVSQSGDTLSFNVQSIAQNQDKSIGDVLRRLPGIGVAEDGTISYNGNIIRNLYIHGDDLMGGRYGVATKSIPKELITSINIMQNHQPIKAIQNKIHTDNVAIDLILKEEKSIKVSGKLQVGVGIPKLYETEGTQMLLNSKLKMLNSLGSNNAGISYENQMKSVGAASMTGSMATTVPGIKLSLGGASAPHLPQIYYLQNQSFYTSLNNLVTFKNKLQLRLNLSALNDFNTFTALSNITNYLPKDTIQYLESQRLRSKPLMREAGVNLLLNKETYFLNNYFKVNWISNNDTGQMHFNDQQFDQSYYKRIRNVSNEFNYIPSYKKNTLLEVKWLLEHNLDNQVLDIGAGYISPFTFRTDSLISQSTAMPAFVSHSSVSYKYISNQISQDYSGGFRFEKQKLRSVLSSEDNTIQPLDSGNYLSWNKSYPYLSALYQIKLNKIRYEIYLPVEYHTINFQQNNANIDSKNKKLLFSPKISANIHFSPEKQLISKYSFNSTLGDITQIYPNAILLNYKSLTANEPILQSKNTHNTTLEYRYEKALSMLFINSRASYFVINSNTMQTWQYEENIQQSKIISLQNQQKVLSLRGNVSKYFWKPKLRIALDGAWDHMELQQQINNSLTPINSKTYGLKSVFEKTWFSSISTEYSASVSINRSTSKNTHNMVSFDNKFSRFEHKGSLVFNSSKQFQARVSGINSKTNASNNNTIRYFFLDLGMNYKPKLKGIEFTMNITNILNEKRFELYNVNANQALRESYDLRGRTWMFRATRYF